MSKLAIKKGEKPPAKAKQPAKVKVATMMKHVRIVVTKRFMSVSYSRWRDHTRCPYFAALKHLQKLPEGPEGPALARGNEIHKLAEDVILGKLKKVPDELRPFEKELLDFRKAKATPEIQWGFDRDWNPVDWFDWNNCFMRVKADVFSVVKTVAKIVDWKTGRYRPEEVDAYEKQLELYAPAAMIMAPKAKTVEAIMAFTDHGKQEDRTFASKDLRKFKLLWADRLRPMLDDTKFVPTPNAGCRYCHYRRNNGGPCIY